jgi:hypothetical protein
LRKRVLWIFKSQSMNLSTTFSRCENTVEFHTGNAWGSLLSTRIHGQVAKESNIWQLPDTLHSTGWMDHRQIRHGCFNTFWYSTLWLSKMHTVTLHHVITAYDSMFNYINRVRQFLAKKKTQCKEGLFYAVKILRQKLSQ